MSAPDPAVQAESTGGLSGGITNSEWLDVVCAAGRPHDQRRLMSRILVDRLAARAAVQAREVAEARAEELRLAAHVLESAKSWLTVGGAAAYMRDRAGDLARLARAGGDGE